MRQIRYSISILIALLTVAILSITSGCTPDYDTEFEEKRFEVVYKDRGIILMTPKGGEKVIRIETNLPMGEWSATTKSEWITLTPSESQVLVQIPPYNDFGVRKGTITIEYGHSVFNIPVEQSSAHKMVMEVKGLTEGQEFVETFPADGGELKVQVKSNVPITDVVVPDSCAWLVLQKLENISKDVIECTFDVQPSDHVRARFATAYLYSSADITAEASFSIMQKKRDYVLVPLDASMLATNAQDPTEGPIEHICDGNEYTYFHTTWQWNENTYYTRPHNITITLGEPITNVKFEYCSRHNGNGDGDITKAEVYYKETDDSDWILASTITFQLPSGRRSWTIQNENAVKFENPIKHLKLVPLARRNHSNIAAAGPGGAWFNMAELRLYTGK
ncbi:MAG: discoidin domain-containing protein [Porphyromonas sp.]|nr:discoidin domain-containing protein [Porphyromonas sp.]